MALIPIKYVGLKKTGDTDHLYGTNIVWTHPGDVQDVPEEKVPFLLSHPDVWVDARKAALRKNEPIESDTPRAKRMEEEEEGLLGMPAKLHLMPKADLVTYALTEFGERLDPSKTEAEVRTDVVRLMHTRG